MICLLLGPARHSDDALHVLIDARIDGATVRLDEYVELNNAEQFGDVLERVVAQLLGA